MVDWLVRRGRYVFDRRVFWAVFLIIVLVVMAAMVEARFTWRGVSQHCPEGRGVGCLNFYYSEVAGGFICMAPDSRLCEPMVLAPGQTLGYVPGFWERNALFLTWIILLAGFVANHGMHNIRRVKREG